MVMDFRLERVKTLTQLQISRVLITRLSFRGHSAPNRLIFQNCKIKERKENVAVTNNLRPKRLFIIATISRLNFNFFFLWTLKQKMSTLQFVTLLL